MEGNQIQTGFVSISNLVSEILMEIGDVEEKKYQTMVLQRVINTIRDINVNFSSSYEEVAVTLDSDLRTGAYPQDLVKAISVGIYKHGEFWSFTKVPEMARTMTGDGETYDEDFDENDNILSRGFLFGASGTNFGYWTPDDKNCRFIVRNYTKDKVILRYRSNGIKCTTQTCIPYLAKDLIVAMVTFHLAMKNIPRRYTGAQLQLMRDERARHYDQFTDKEYIPHNFDEFMDAQWASLNTVPRRG